LADIRQATPEQILKGKQSVERDKEHGMMAVSLGPKPLWARPEEGALKLNIDGAYVKETGQAGAGMIMRRADGSVVFSACRVLRHCSSAFEAELLACLEGIRFAADMDLSHITIESDCQTLVSVATKDNRDGSALGHLIEDLRVMLASERFDQIVKISRYCNKSSHELARFGMREQRSQLWVGSVPSDLWDLIQRDCNNSISS
jgi:ribonuclease HI